MATNGGASTWSQPEPYNALTSMGSQDFSNLPDLDVNFDFDFLNDFDPANSGDHAGKLAGSIDSDLYATSAQQQHAVHATHHSSAPLTMAQTSPIFDVGMHYSVPNRQPFTGMQIGHNALGLQQMVPPTPNSVEMHANAAHYMQQMDAQSRAMMDHYQMQKSDAMNNFTPLGTPAVTPHELINNDYTVPGTYFSPLASPMLDGQSRNGQHTSASSGATVSPIDHDVDMIRDSAPQADFATKKPVKKASRSLRINGNRKVAQSPIQKPQRKKTAVLAIQSREMNELLEATQQSRLSPTSPRKSLISQSNSTSSDSISPEPLTEVMGPPPKPASAKPSPAILGKSPNFAAGARLNSPATPASLMRLQSNGEATDAVTAPSPIHETGVDVPMLEELALPEAVMSAPKRPSVPRIDTANTSGDVTPRLGARGGTKSGAITPIIPSAGSASTKHTPTNSAVTSPTNVLASPVISKQGPKSKITKKRGSMSSNVQLSPAIRPKISISPNIQPLLPGGGPGVLSDQERTTFLASRSNYQNLIEGTNIPGVSYPSDLPTQLTSKRTSHKIAEQGRRQRINIALQKMQQLLPKSLPGEKKGENDDEDDDDEDDDNGKRKGSGGGKGGGNSKAATVESAIVYIEQLQLQNKQWEEGNDARERQWVAKQEADQKQLAELKQKVKELEEKLAAVAATAQEAIAGATNDVND